MIEVCDSHYPLVSIKFEGVVTLVETENYLGRLNEWLARKQPFVLMMDRTNPERGEDPEEGKKSHAAIINWSKQNKEKMAQYCAGMAIVEDLSRISERQQQTLPKTLNLLFGCPGQLFSNITDAKQWLRQQLKVFS